MTTMPMQRFANRLPLWLEKHAASLQVICVLLSFAAAGALAWLVAHATTGDRIVTFATVLAAGLIAIRLTGGQFNASMEIAVTTQRHSRKDGGTAKHHMVVNLTLKRGPMGRVRIEEVLFELTRLCDGDSGSAVLRSPVDPHRERIILAGPNEDPAAKDSSTPLPEMHCAVNPKVRLRASSVGTALPPGDATQLAYVFEVGSEDAFHVDVTIIGRRTAAWLGYPQWRASATSFP